MITYNLLNHLLFDWQRFYEHGGEVQVAQDALLKPSMDIFSVGWAVGGFYLWYFADDDKICWDITPDVLLWSNWSPTIILWSCLLPFVNSITNLNGCHWELWPPLASFHFYQHWLGCHSFICVTYQFTLILSWNLIKLMPSQVIVFSWIDHVENDYRILQFLLVFVLLVLLIFD